MITEIRDRPLAIISDLHLGNPFSKAKKPVVHFLRWASQHGYDVVINGDGFEIAQASFTKIARDVPEVFQAMKTFTQKGGKIYYVIGNHDIALEHLLNDWGGFKMAPFLNVWSGQKRIRIEHGHLYDPFFVRYPNTYEFLTWAAGLALKIHPSFYKAWIALEKFKSRFVWKTGGEGIFGEHASVKEAARELANRGFDDVVFGHTHHPGRCELAPNKYYYNSGSWLTETPFVEVCNGEVSLRKWHKDLAPHSQLLKLQEMHRSAELSA